MIGTMRVFSVMGIAVGARQHPHATRQVWSNCGRCSQLTLSHLLYRFGNDTRRRGDNASISMLHELEKLQVYCIPAPRELAGPTTERLQCGHVRSCDAGHECGPAVVLVAVADGMAECAAAANVAVKPAPSAHRFAATGLTATRGREEAIDAVDAALCLSQPTGKRVGADASSV